MAVSGPSEDQGEGGGIFADINITPLTDIFLVLLIIFMVTTTAIAEQDRTSGLHVSLPRGGKVGAVQPAAEVPIAVLADGRTVVRGKVVDETALRELLAAAQRDHPDALVLVQADEGVAHGRVVAVMELARRQGLTKLAIATRAARE